MLLLMRFDMVPADGDGKGFLDCLNFANNIAVPTHDVLDGEGGTVVESVEDTGIVHVVVVGGAWWGVTSSLEVREGGAEKVKSAEVAVGFSAERASWFCM